MKRELFGKEIRQKSKSEFFSATDLVRAGNSWRAIESLELFDIKSWLARKSTKEFIEELEKQTGYNAIIRAKAKNKQTWLHPYLFIDLALAISPKLKIEVYSWLYDHLLHYRNGSGDSYKKMTGALYQASANKTKFPKAIIKVAEKIREACGVDSWQYANEEQLKLRDKIHENIALLSDIVPPNDAIRIGIKKGLNN